MIHSRTIRTALQGTKRSRARSEHATIDGLIIAGGAASRLAGRNKALVTWRGVPLIDWVSQALRPQVRGLHINANRDLERLQPYCDAIWRDRELGFPGPLAGLEVASKQLNADFLACVPCDTPYLPPDLVHRLYSGLDQAPAAHVFDGTRPQPLCCLLSKEALLAVSTHRIEGGASMHSFLQSIGSVSVDFSDRATAFFNVNEPTAWEEPPLPPPWIGDNGRAG